MKSANQRQPNLLLRQQRQLRGWSLQRVVEELCALSEAEERLPGVNVVMVSNWETGTKKPSPFYQERLCKLYQMSAAQLGFMEVAPSLHPDQSGLSQPPPTLPPLSQDTQQTQLVNNDNAGTSLSSVLAKEPTEHPFLASLSPETIANLYPSRRSVLQTFGVVGAGIIAAPHVLVKHHPPDVSAASVANLATITQQYRAMQRRGDTFIRHGLNVHLTTLQDALERTINDTIRRELWRVLAQTQLLARLNWHSTKKLELAQVKALNEAAIISAQNSGDRVLVGAALGHLAHLYLSEAQDTQSASQLLDRAREHVQYHHALNGWFDIVTAAIAAKEGNRQECEAAIADAMHAAYSMPQTPESADPYFTDFSLTSVEAFAGNCWLSVEEPEQAYRLLTSISIDGLAMNRHASALYDISRAYFAAGHWEEAQGYALRSIDTALTTNRLYIIPRFITIAQKLLLTDYHEAHATTILDYAHTALQTN